MKALFLRPVRRPLLVAIILAGTVAHARAQNGQLNLLFPEQTLRNAIVGVAYHQPIRVVAAIGEIDVESTDPLPPGMLLELTGDRKGVSLVGMPLATGEFTFSLTATDSTGRVASGVTVLRVVSLPLEIIDDPAGDIDFDGLPNLAEHGMGRSAFVHEPYPPMQLVSVDGAPHFLGILDPSVSELRRVVQVWSPSLGIWRDSAIDPTPSPTGNLFVPLSYNPELPGDALGRLLFSIPTTKGEQLDDLIKKLNELAEKVKDAESDLEENPLVEEMRLIELIAEILKQPSDVTDLLEEWLNGVLDDLFPPLEDLSVEDYNNLVDRINRDFDRIKKALCYAKQLLDFLIKVTQDPDEKAQLEAAADQIERVKNLMEDAEDLETIYDELRRGLDGLKDLLADKIEEVLKDQLEEFIRKQLVRRFGAGAASAIMSAAIDVFNLIDALIAQGRLEEARALYHMMLFQMFELAYQCKKYHIDCEIWNTDDNDPRLQFPANECPTGKKVTVQACLRCWEQEPDGAPNEGSFSETPVKFAGGVTTLEKSNFTSDDPNECSFKFRLDLEDFKAKAADCPHAHLILKVRTDDGPVVNVLGGVYRP